MLVRSGDRRTVLVVYCEVSTSKTNLKLNPRVITRLGCLAAAQDRTEIERVWTAPLWREKLEVGKHWNRVLPFGMPVGFEVSRGHSQALVSDVVGRSPPTSIRQA
jgi:hypothetical protein